MKGNAEGPHFNRAATGAGFVFSVFRTAQIEIPAGVGRHQSIATITAFDFPCHPSIAGFSRGLVALARHDFLPHPKPQLGRDETLAGGQHQHLALQMLVLVFGAALAPIILLPN